MARIPNKTIIKTLIRQTERLEKLLKGHSMDYKPGELAFVLKALQQVKDDYKDAEYIGRPLNQSPLSFEREVNSQPDLFPL